VDRGAPNRFLKEGLTKHAGFLIICNFSGLLFPQSSEIACTAVPGKMAIEDGNSYGKAGQRVSSLRSLWSLLIK